MKNRKRKYTSILLTVMMVAVILMPMFSATPVFAATTRCGITANWTGFASGFPSSGYYYLTGNVTFSGKRVLNGNLYLDLNGYTITFTGTQGGSAIDLDKNKNFYLYDSVGGGKLKKDAYKTSYDRCVWVSNGAIFEMHGGTIDNFQNSSQDGGAVALNNGGIFYMYGGTISNCKGYNGGAVCVINDTTGSFYMYGGKITDCISANGNGGAVDISNDYFYMSGGTITNCTSPMYGGGVSVWDGGTFTMAGGTICNCWAKFDDNVYGGGGVYICKGATFNMSSGNIYSNTAKAYGGGVFCYGTFNMSGGSIYLNTAEKDGGGVNINSCTFTMTGGKIYSNSANYGGAVSAYNATIKVNGGTISKNTASTYSGIAANNNSTTYTSGRFSTVNAYYKTPSGSSYITFNQNGGTGGATSFTQSWGLTLPNVSTPTRTGYTFNGYYDSNLDWYYNADGTPYNKYNDGTKWDYIGAQTLNADWIPNTYTIVYDTNGGEGTYSNISAKYGTSYNLSATEPTKTGYTFTGWNTVKDGSGTTYQAGATVNNLTTTNGATVTLYAQWKANTNTVTLNSNGGIGSTTYVTATYDSAMPSATMPTRTGYTFNGYFDAETDGTKYYNADGTSAKNWDKIENTTLYAQWTANQYTVTLNNGESVANGSVTATYDANLPDVTIPTWEKHVFYGYFTEADGKGDKYIDKDGKGVKSWDKTTDDTTLYAFWKDSAKVESIDLMLGGDIGMQYHVAVNDTVLQNTGTATVYVGSKKPSSETFNASDVSNDTNGFYIFPFNVNSIQMAEKVTVEFKDKDGKVIDSDSKSVEDYYNLVLKSDASVEQKEMVRTLVDYGYYAQQALSKTHGWTIGTDYAKSNKYGELKSSKDDLKAYKPVISGKDANVRDIQLSLLLDNKTTLCVYVLTKDGVAPEVTVDGEKVTPEDNEDGWWLVKISDIDALNLSTIHTVEVGGYTVYLSALSYASVASDAATIEAMRALRDYYEATLKANGKTALTSATVEQNEYEYTGSKIEPVLTVKAGDDTVTDYKVDWNGDLINAGTYTGLVTSKNHVGGVTVKVTITPKSVTAPKPVNATLTYNGEEQTGVVGSETPVNGPMKAQAMNVVPEEPGYTLSGNTAIDAGKYTATAMLKDAVNYCWDDGTTTPKSYEWSIEPLKVEIPKAEVTEFGYDGTQKILEVAKNEFYTIRSNVATDAGEYTATVTLINTNNTCWSDGSIADKQIAWKITKKVVEKPQYTVGELTYTGVTQTGVTVASNEAYTISGTTTATKAGSYTATITLNKNYSWPDGSTEAIEIKWSIAKKKIYIPAANTGLVYNKSEQIGVNSGEGYTLSGTTKAINAGSYTATATLTDTKNTCWSNNTTDAKTINWSIAKATPTVTGTVNVTYHPNGGSAEFGGTYERSVEGTFSYDSSNNKTTFVPDDKVNYNVVEVIATVTEDPTVNTMNVTLGG